MSNLDIRAIAPAGYVRACFSERAQGFCLPAELVRRHLGAVNASGVRRRLAREFVGYLVTEPPVAKVLPHVWREFDTGRVVLISDDCRTGADSLPGLRKGFEVFRCGSALDASEWLPGGSCREYLTASGEVCCAVAGFVGREQ